jgi:hypothetical protein
MFRNLSPVSQSLIRDWNLYNKVDVAYLGVANDAHFKLRVQNYQYVNDNLTDALFKLFWTINNIN